MLSDHFAYERLGRSITGARYEKWEHGHLPSELLLTERDLVAQDGIEQETVHYFGKALRKISARDDPHMEDFSEDEIAVVEGVLKRYGHESATYLSSLVFFVSGWPNRGEKWTAGGVISPAAGKTSRRCSRGWIDRSDASSFSRRAPRAGAAEQARAAGRRARSRRSRSVTTSTRPFAHVGHVHCKDGTVGRFAAVLRVLLSQQHERALSLLALVEYAGAAAEADPPEAAPVFFVVVDKDRDVWPGAGVFDAPQLGRALRLAVDRGIERVAVEREHDRNQVRTAVWVRRRQPRDSRRR
jgi:antitoxin SocA-like protein